MIYQGSRFLFYKFWKDELRLQDFRSYYKTYSSQDPDTYNKTYKKLSPYELSKWEE